VVGEGHLLQGVSDGLVGGFCLICLNQGQETYCEGLLAGCVLDGSLVVYTQLVKRCGVKLHIMWILKCVLFEVGCC